MLIVFKHKKTIQTYIPPKYVNKFSMTRLSQVAINIYTGVKVIKL